MSKKDILILGAGLSGMTTAYLLQQKGVEATILESRDRIGGRIFTLKKNGQAPLEMGATWLGKKHQRLMQLLNQLNIDIFPQFQGNLAVYEPISTSPPQLVSLPDNPDPSYRIKGGSMALIDALKNTLSPAQIKLNQKVVSITQAGKKISVQTKTDTFEADVVVSTLPPNLLTSSINFSPALPESFVQTSNLTHTWMGESIKVGLTFDQPFWKSKNTSGTIFSNVGPISEMYDHSNFENSYFALKGFLNGAFYIASKEERQAVVTKQLKKYYGPQVDQFLSYEEYIWRKDPDTFVDYSDPILPHQNNGHPIFRSSYFDGGLLISGAETAEQFPGYMDGAVSSAFRVVDQILNINL